MGVTLSLSTYGAFLAPIPSQMSRVTNCPSPSHLPPPSINHTFPRLLRRTAFFVYFSTSSFLFRGGFIPGSSLLPPAESQSIHCELSRSFYPRAGGWENFGSKTPAQKPPVIQFGAGGEGEKLIFILLC